MTDPVQPCRPCLALQALLGPEGRVWLFMSCLILQTQSLPYMPFMFCPAIQALKASLPRGPCPVLPYRTCPTPPLKLGLDSKNKFKKRILRYT